MWVVWIDANGQQQVRSITTLTGAAAILTELEFISNATPKTYAEGDLILPGGIPTSGPYLSVRQVAQLTFVDGTGSTAVLSVPSPLLGIFGPDGDTIDASAITALIASCIGNLLSGAGNPVVSYVKGILVSGPANN